MSPLGLIASEMIKGYSKPLLTAVQVSPLSVDRKTPPNVPAKMYPSELIASARTSVAVSPLLTAVHVSPLSVERKAPPPSVPAKTYPLAFVASARTSPPCGPCVDAQKSSTVSCKPVLALSTWAAFAPGFVPFALANAIENVPTPDSTRKTPAKKTNKPIKTRRLKNADTECFRVLANLCRSCKADFLFIFFPSLGMSNPSFSRKRGSVSRLLKVSILPILSQPGLLLRKI